MSQKGGKILWDLWNRVDQADWDLTIKKAFDLSPTYFQKQVIKSMLENNQWDLSGEPSKEIKEKAWEFVNK